MKKIILIVVVAAGGALCSYSQAVVDFANAAAGVFAPITDITDNKLSGNTYLADFFYAPDPSGNLLPFSSFTDAGLAIPFLTGSGAGFFADSTGVTLIGSGQFQFYVVAWQSAAGATWAQAISGPFGPAENYVEHGGFEWGFSNPFLVTPNTFPGPPFPMVGLTSFGMNSDLELPPSPEPSTVAIGGLGAAIMLLFLRRRKNGDARQL